MVKELDLKSLMKELQSGKKAIVDFWAPWCGPCKMFGPIFDAVSKDTANVNFFKVNVEDNPEAASQLGIQSIPCVVLFKGGEEVNRFNGVKSEDALKETIAEIF